MAALDHWHPLLPAKKLRRQPVAVRLAGKDLVLFRTSQGIGALEDRCPHRRMKLSRGSIVNDRLRCQYHGWSYDREGNGESPSTPKLYACANPLEATEKHGFIWAKSLDSRPAFPTFDVEGWYNVCNLDHKVNAPLEVVVDNFCEIEHTPTTHEFFGYPLEKMQDVEVRFEPTDTSVRVVNHGPSKPIILPMRFILAMRKHYQFNDDWTTYFSPVYSVYNHWWSDPVSGKENWVKWKLYIFFTPIDDANTALATFAYTQSKWPGPTGLVCLFKWLMRRMLDKEIQLDVNILEGLADKSPDISGMKLSRFDRVLGLNRERIDRVYRGIEPRRCSAHCESEPAAADSKLPSQSR